MQIDKDELGEIDIDWKEPPSLRDLKSDLEEAMPYHQEQVSKIEEWLDNLYVRGKAKIKTEPNRSSVVPKLIRKQAEWRYAALSEPFLNSRDIFKVEPVTWEDTEAAEQNELLLNHQFNVRIDKNRFIDEYVRTAVDEGTVIVRVGWKYEDTEEEVEKPVYEYVPDPQLQPILEQVLAIRETNPNAYFRDVPEELKESLRVSEEAGQPIRAVVTGTKTVTETKIIANHPTVEVCHYRNLVLDPTSNGDIEKANFVIYSFESSIAELKKDGRYKNLDDINVGSASIEGDPDHDPDGAPNFTFSDDARKKFVVYEYWGFRDVNGDGKLTSFVASWVGDTLIRLEDNPFPDQKLPFVVVQYLPVRRSLYGEPDGALLEDNQKIIGAVTRGMIDILGRSANGQIGMRRDMLDAANRRKFAKGLDYEFNVGVDPQQGIYMHKFPEIPQSAPFMLQQQASEAESLTGVKSFNGGLSGDSLGETATGIRGVLDAASKRELGILRRLATGMVSIAKKIVAMNAEFLSEEEVIRITNDNFVKVRRDELAGEFDLSIDISTAEEDAAKAQELGFILQTVGNSIDFNITKKIFAKLFKLQRMPDLAKEIEEFQPQPDPVQQQMQQLEMQKIMAEIQKLQSEANENNATAGREQARGQLDLAKAEHTTYQTDKVALDFVEQESGIKQERELQKQGEQARANAKLKLLENAIKNAK